MNNNSRVENYSTVVSYSTVVRLEETTDGGYCYIAYHPEFPSAMSQGDTAAEAKENLIEATEMAIEHLIEYNLPIPQPMPLGAIYPESPGVTVKSATAIFPSPVQKRTFLIPSAELVTA